MGIVALVDFEEGDFTDFTSTTNETDMAVNGTAAMVGSYGLVATQDGNQNATYGQTDFSHSSNVLRCRFYFNTDNLTMASGSNYVFFLIRQDGTEGGTYAIFYVELSENSGDYRVRLIAGTDAASTVSNGYHTFSTSSGNHYLEFVAYRETTDTAADGYIEWGVDGSAMPDITGIDNYAIFQYIYTVRVGPQTGLDAGTTGDTYYDDVIIRDDDTEIGPAEALSVVISRETTFQQGVRVYP